MIVMAMSQNEIDSLYTTLVKLGGDTFAAAYPFRNALPGGIGWRTVGRLRHGGRQKPEMAYVIGFAVVVALPVSLIPGIKFPRLGLIRVDGSTKRWLRCGKA